MLFSEHHDLEAGYGQVCLPLLRGIELIEKYPFFSGNYGEEGQAHVLQGSV